MSTKSIIKEFLEWRALAEAGHPGYKPFTDKNIEASLSEALDKQEKETAQKIHKELFANSTMTWDTMVVNFDDYKRIMDKYKI